MRSRQGKYRGICGGSQSEDMPPVCYCHVEELPANKAGDLGFRTHLPMRLRGPR